VASASDNHTVQIWSVDSDYCRQKLEGHHGLVYGVVFSPDGLLLASASWDKTVRIWSVDDGNCKQTLKGHDEYVDTIAFSPGSRLIISGSHDYTARIWSVTTGVCQQVLKGHDSCIRSVAFSPDSQLAASASEDQTVRIFSANNGNCQKVLEGHRHRAHLVVFSPDGQLVASASLDATLRIWSVDDGYCQKTLYTGITYSLSFEHSSRRLLTDVGIFEVGQPSQRPTASSGSVSTVTLPKNKGSDGCRIGLGINPDKSWITLDGKQLLWLPAEYRPVFSAISGSTVALGCGSGQVVILQFSLNHLGDF
jgi:WD40 repeat protein